VSGDIYDNFVAGALDDSNGVPAGTASDVAMALGWNFSLGAGAVEVVFYTSLLQPDVPFYLWQSDAASEQTIYLWSVISSSGVPEPGTLMLFGIGLASLGLARRRRV
jgi:hypothetical protein